MAGAAAAPRRAGPRELHLWGLEFQLVTPDIASSLGVNNLLGAIVEGVQATVPRPAPRNGN
jgi:hypothetical protein